MTADGDFITTNAEQPSYPTVFGVTITPMVIGLMAVVVGIGGAYWLFTNLVQPIMQETAQISQEIADKEKQLMDQGELQKRIAAARKRIKDAEQLRSDVLSLFASKDNVDTLLLDINERIRAVNGGVTNTENQATLTKFDLNTAQSGVISDSSFGAQVNGRLERRVFDVELQGSFTQTQSIIRNIERLQTLLVVTNLKSELKDETGIFELNAQGQPVTVATSTKLVTTFQLAALLPTVTEASASMAAENGQGAQ